MTSLYIYFLFKKKVWNNNKFKSYGARNGKDYTKEIYTCNLEPLINLKTQKKKRGEIYKIARNKEWHSLISKKYRVVTSEWVMRRAVKSKESFGMTLNMGARTHQERSKRWECKLWIYCRERERKRGRGRQSF